MRPGGWTAADIPDLGGRTAVVTGGNTGLGLETARALAAHGAAVVLAVRDVAKGEVAAADIRTTAPGSCVVVQPLDLASLASIRTAAAALRASTDGIDLLVNNAGVMWTKRAVTVDGFELQLGVNHLGHFALTGLLLGGLLPVDGSRVVTVSSLAHRFRSALDVDDLRAPRPPHLRAPRPSHRSSAYARSKLANLLFTFELERRLARAAARTAALAAHPGWTSTGIVRNAPWLLRAAERVGRPLGQRPAAGALPTLRAATDPDAVGGSYFGPGGFAEMWGSPRPVGASARAHDAGTAARLWDASEAATGVTFPL